MASSLIGNIFKDRNKPKRSDPPNEECNEGKIELFTPGKFYIPGQLETNPVVVYQADSASVHAEGRSEVSEEVRGQRLSASKESWQNLKPVVDCGNDAMTLTVRRRRAVQLQLSRGNESSVPLSQPPPQCGYSVQNTWRDLSVIARYDACHVKQEEEGFVLPLLWRGTPVKMSCPTPQIQPRASGPSSLCCSLHGMTLTVQGPHAAEDIRVNVRGKWMPLLVLEEWCGYAVERRDAEIIIAAPFITCGITDEDGKHTLSLQIEENTFTVACPVSPPEELGPSHHPPHLQTENIPESLESFLWAPPFYLAPLNYPHPTYHHKYPPLHESSSTAGLSLAPVDSPPDDPHQIPAHFNIPTPQSSPENVENSHPVYPDPQETHVMGVSMKLSAAPSPVTVQDEAPSLQPSSHGLNSYYHYYHHPKIPLPDTTQNPDPGPEEPGKQSFTNPPQNPGFLENSHFLQPVMEAASPPISTLPASAPHPPHPYPFPYYYFPHIARGEDQRLPPLDPEMTPNLSEDQKSDTSVHPRSSQVHDEHNPFNPYYHYYHPKIPQPGLPQDPDSGPEAPGEQSLTHFTQNPGFQEKSHQFLQPGPEAASLTSSLPDSPPKTSAPDAPHPPHPYPFPFHYVAHIGPEEAQRLPSLDPETTLNLSEDQNSKSVHPRSSDAEATSLTSSPPGSPLKTNSPEAPYPPHPHPFPYYYFPHMAPGEDKGLPPPNLLEDQKSDTSIHPRSSQVLDEHNPFNPYYHYYHPKIPQPGLPQDPDSGPEARGERSLTHFTQNHGFQEKSHQFLQPGPEAASLTSSLPESPPNISAQDAPHPPHPYPFLYYYFPHIVQEEAQRLPSLDAEMTPNLSEDQKSDTSVHPRSSQVHNEPNSFNPYYHYYQQPEILLRASHQDPKPGPEEPALSNPLNPEFPTQQSEVLHGVISHQFPQPVTEAALLISSLPENPPKTSAADAPPPPYPFPYYYFLHIARDDVKRSVPLDPETGPDTSVHPRSSQPNTFNPYCHYHLEIPLPGKPQDTDPGPEEPGELSLTNLPQNREFLENSHQLLQSGPEAETFTSSPPESPPKASASDAPYPPHPYPFPYYYFPHIARGDVQRLPPLSLEANPDLSEDQKSDASVHPRSSQVHDEHNSYPYYQYYYQHLKIPQTGPNQDPDSQEWSPTNPLSYEFPENSDVASSPSESPLKSAPEAPLPPYPYPYPHYYFPHIAWGEPEAFVDPQEMHPAGNMNFEKASESQLPSDLSGLDHAAEAGFPSMPQQLRSLNPYYVTHQQQVDAFGLPDGEEVGKRMDGEMKDCTSGQHLIFVVPDSVLDHRSEISPARLMVQCSSSPGSPGEERLHVMSPPPLPPVQSPVSTVTVQLRIATDESFSSFHPEAHLPLSVIGGGSVYLQLSLQDPPAPPHLLLLLVHSCLAFTHPPYSSWTFVYDGCRGDSQLLPPSRSDPPPTQRILIPALQSLPSESPPPLTEGGSSHLQDPEISFMCLTEVCYAADVNCTISCVYSPDSDM